MEYNKHTAGQEQKEPWTYFHEHKMTLDDTSPIFHQQLQSLLQRTGISKTIRNTQWQSQKSSQELSQASTCTKQLDLVVKI